MQWYFKVVGPCHFESSRTTTRRARIPAPQKKRRPTLPAKPAVKPRPPAESGFLEASRGWSTRESNCPTGTALAAESYGDATSHPERSENVRAHESNWESWSNVLYPWQSRGFLFVVFFLYSVSFLSSLLRHATLAIISPKCLNNKSTPTAPRHRPWTSGLPKLRWHPRRHPREYLNCGQ